MKKATIAATVIYLMTAASTFAQDAPKTLFNAPKLKNISVIINPEYQNGQLSNNFTSFKGLSASVVFNNTFSLGLFSTSVLNPNYVLNTVTTDAANARYGGLKLEYTLKPNSVIHFTFPLYIGTGTAQATQNFGRGGNRSANSFFVAQTGFQVEANLFKFVKLYTGSTYRFSDLINASTSNPLSSNTLSGLSFDVGLKFGVFGKTYKK